MVYDWGPTLHDEIDARYSNRILPGVGLVVCTVDILSCGDAPLPPGDGAAFADGEGYFLSSCRPLSLQLCLSLHSLSTYPLKTMLNSQWCSVC
jgi:hypothetical protein